VNLFISHAVPVDVFKETFLDNILDRDAQIRFSFENVMEEVPSCLINVPGKFDFSLYGLLLNNHRVFYLTERKATINILKVKKVLTVDKAHRAKCQSSIHPLGNCTHSGCPAAPQEQYIPEYRSWWWFDTTTTGAKLSRTQSLSS
jgi:hypothetical protein